MSSQQQDSLIVAMSIARKIQYCNESQLDNFLTETYSIFKQHKEFNLLISTFMKGICLNHSRIKSKILQQINSILPNEKQLKIKDSITKSELILNKIKTSNAIKTHKNKTKTKTRKKRKTKKQTVNFLKIPSDLKIYLFQYLEERELYEMEKTCRSICIDARNPNSLFQAKINDTIYINKYTQNYRYNKVKSIHFTFDDTVFDSDEEFEDYEEERSEPILPPNNTFNELCEIKLDLAKFQLIQSEFDNALNLFYNLLINGNTKKVDISQAKRWDISQYTFIFNKYVNKMAQRALENVKSMDITIEGIDAMSIIMNNIHRTLTNDCHRIHRFDKIKLNVTEYIDHHEAWNWELFKEIKAYCQEIDIFIHFMTEYDQPFWNIMPMTLFDEEVNTKYVTKLSMKYEFEDWEMNIVDNYNEHIKHWLNIDNKMLIKMGIKSIDIEWQYSLWFPNEHDASWRKDKYQELEQELTAYCLQHGLEKINTQISVDQPAFIIRYKR